MRTTKLTYDAGDTVELDRLSDGITESLKRNLYSFTRVRTSGTCTLITKKEKIEIIPVGELSGRGARFVGEVKKHFSGMKKPLRLSHDRAFYEYFRPVSTYMEIEDVVEIDINHAYWESARKLGYLTPELYRSAEKVNKKSRLIALGALGKRTVTTKFTPPYDNPESLESYADTRIFWDNIVWNLGESIREVTARYKPHVFGIWFDAIFCTRQSAENIRRFLQRRGYETKIKPVRSYIVKPRNGVLPGAKITRIFADGSIKEMDVSYYDKEKQAANFMEFLGKLK